MKTIKEGHTMKAKRHIYNQHGDCIECGMLAVLGDGSSCPAINKIALDECPKCHARDINKMSGEEWDAQAGCCHDCVDRDV